MFLGLFLWLSTIISRETFGKKLFTIFFYNDCTIYLQGHLSHLLYRHMKVDFLQGDSDRQQKEASLVEKVYVL